MIPPDLGLRRCCLIRLNGKSGNAEAFLVCGAWNRTGRARTFIRDATQDAFSMQVDTTRHGDYGDGAWVDKADDPGRRAGTAILACVLSFAKKYLKAEDDHLLDNPSATYPEIVRFQKR